VALFGLITITLAYLSCQHFAFALGHKIQNVHTLLPFLLLGIGVDDMFVICNAVDQTDINKPTLDRIQEAFAHAGPSITLTSMTDAIAFFCGSSSSIMALKSFCVFAGLSIAMLFYGIITIFSAVLVFDMRR
jgi:Niemann-Pick C1 protein